MLGWTDLNNISESERGGSEVSRVLIRDLWGRAERRKWLRRSVPSALAQGGARSQSGTWGFQHVDSHIFDAQDTTDRTWHSGGGRLRRVERLVKFSAGAERVRVDTPSGFRRASVCPGVESTGVDMPGPTWAN